MTETNKSRSLVMVEITLRHKTRYIRCFETQLPHLIRQYRKKAAFQHLAIYTLH